MRARVTALCIGIVAASFAAPLDARADIAAPPDAASIMSADAGDGGDAATSDDGGTSAISESKVGGCTMGGAASAARSGSGVFAITIAIALGISAARRRSRAAR